jgi:Holliday junction DNA helicase RuvA
LIERLSLISRITGTLGRLTETEAYIEAGPFEYEVWVPEFVRRQLQLRIGETISLRTLQYLEGNPQKGGRMTPRLVGFLSEAEMEFFDLVCSVDGVGVKKALRAMVRPVREVATAIEEQDLKYLATLPGVGNAVAERIVAKLRRKMTRFALMAARELPDADAGRSDVLADANEALIALGHSAVEARRLIETATVGGKRFKNVEELLTEIYRRGRE